MADADAPADLARILQLTLDIQILIISFLEPPYILRLRVTCTTFQLATSHLIVWIEALRQVCLANGLFLPTFPLADMSLKELESAALAPYKWRSVAARAYPHTQELPAHSHLFSPMASDSSATDDGEPGEEDDYDLRSVFLVPGGRYLVTFAWRWIAVWDLGFSPYRGRGSFTKVIARAKVKLHSKYLVHASPDGRALRVLISCPIVEDDEASPEEICIYEIYPEHANPQLTLIASLVFPGDEDSSFYSICGNRFVLLQDNVVKIWDFVTNHWAAWTVEGEFYQSIVDRNFVFLLHAGGVSMWRIPRLQSSSPPFNVVDPTPVISTVDLQYRRRTPTDDDQYAGPCDWYSGTGLPLVYDVVVPTDSTNAKLYRCEVQTTSDLQWSGLDEYAPLKITSTHEAPNNMDPYRFCLDTLVARWFDRSMGAARLFTAESRPLDTGPPIPVHTAVLTSTRAVSSFCPASGRFVYIEIDDVEAATPDTDSALEGFVVLDFLFETPYVPALRPVQTRRARSESPPYMSPSEGWIDAFTGMSIGGPQSSTQF